MNNTKITLDDVAGYDDQKREARKIINILKNYEKFAQMGAYISKGVLMAGPNGTGKTSIARAIANESGVPIYEYESGDAEDEEGAVRGLKGLFQEARNHAPAIVFIDEVDELISSGSFMSDYSRKILKTLLTEIDGIKASDGIVVIVTTNHRGALPAALTRSGRMDKKIAMPMPDAKSRYAITDLYLRKNPIFNNVSSIELAKKLGGFSGADIKTLINETLIECIASENENVTIDDFEKMIPVIRFQDIKRSTKTTPDYLTIHESGHFIVNYALTGKIGSLTVEQYGNVRGAHVNEFDEDEEEQVEENNCLVSSLKKEMAVLLGGNVAEKMFLNGDCSTGASNDIARAIDISEQIISSGLLGYSCVYRKTQDSIFPRQTVKDTEEQARLKKELFLEAEETAKKAINEYYDLVKTISQELKKYKRLSRSQLIKLVGCGDNVDTIFEEVKDSLSSWDYINIETLERDMSLNFAKAEKIMDKLRKEGLIERKITEKGFKVIA
ncbi:MAG: AAA family ATPase [Bacilli bacterium]|nr:AAA family ATPase [Bacilli bacterium]